VASPAWAAREQQLAALQAWTLRGRISVRSDDQAWHGTIYWRQQDERYDLKLIAPLGQGTVSVQGGPGGVVLRLPSGEERQAVDPEQLLFQTLGLRLPLSGLRYWVKGLPEPAQRMQGLWDVDGRLVTLNQPGWDISYRGYVREGPYDLPAKVFLDSGTVSVRLVVESWKLGATEQG
jgi:outer membrane lipoprotein LolB